MKNGLEKILILAIETIVILLAVFGLVPREIVLFSAGLMAFYFLFAPLEDSLWLFIVSIPLFTALPISETFDYMANWRFLLIILFLVLFFKLGISVSFYKNEKNKWRIKEKIKHSMVEYLSAVFILICCFSLFFANDFWAGAKKIIFLVNIFILFVVIRNLAAQRKDLIYIIANALKVAAGIVLGLGFLQLLMAFFISLHQFWQVWVWKVIPVFYGNSLTALLSYSNTWFSYYSYQLPTLRMFSVFPDSHSFALFCILCLPFALTNIFLTKSGDKKGTIMNHLFMIACLSAILFSGSRGAWASALLVLVVCIIFFYLVRFLAIKNKKTFLVSKFSLSKRWKQYFQLCAGCLVIFFLLMPIISGILFIPQTIHEVRDSKIDYGKISLFERARSIIDFSEASVKGRLEIWRKTIDSIIMSPLMGVGIGNYPIVLQEKIFFTKRGSSAHSLYLDVAAEVGIFGLVVLLAIFAYILKDAWELFNNCPNKFFKYWAGFFALALIWVLGYSLFDVVLLNDKVFLFFVANLGMLYVARQTFGFD